MTTRNATQPSGLSHAAAIAAILFIAHAIGILIGWLKRSDVKGWWPVALVFYASIDCLYAVLCVALGKAARFLSLRVVVGYTTVLGLAFVAYVYLYYTLAPDWLAVNEGRIALTAFQSILHAGWTWWAIYLIFYLGMVCMTLVIRRCDQEPGRSTGNMVCCLIRTRT